MKNKRICCLLMVSFFVISYSKPMSKTVDLAIAQLESYTLENAALNIRTLYSDYEKKTNNQFDEREKTEIDFKLGERYIEVESKGSTLAMMEDGEKYYMYWELGDSNHDTVSIPKSSFEMNFKELSLETMFNNSISTTSKELEALRGKSDDEIEEFFTKRYLEDLVGTEYTNSVDMKFESIDNHFSFETTFKLQNETQDFEFIERKRLNEYGLPTYIHHYDNKNELDESLYIAYNVTITKFTVQN